MIQKIGLAITTSLLSWNISFAQTIDSYIPSQKNIEARKKFQDNKFGIFIHWGIYSMLAQGEWYMTNHNIDWREYEKLASDVEKELYKEKPYEEAHPFKVRAYTGCSIYERRTFHEIRL